MSPDDLNLTPPNLEILLELVQHAGLKVLAVYNNDAVFAQVEYKKDSSPLTMADKESHNYLYTGLTELSPRIPVLSEEGIDIPYSVRKKWKQFWLIDPLDGTKEFLKRNGEFTINIALVKNRYPYFGIISAPSKGVIYWGGLNYGSFRLLNGKTEKIFVSSKDKQMTAVKSRSHGSDEESRLYSKYDIKEYISIGSALKFCMVAEGVADIYYRHGPTMEWDTAAGQAIVEGAGGKVLNSKNKKFDYNKLSLVNGSFLVNNSTG